MRKKFFGRLWFLMAAVLVLSGCGENKSSEEAVMTSSQTVYSDAAAKTGSGMEEPAEEVAQAADMAVEGSESSKPDVSKADTSERKLIKTVFLSMETKSFDKLKEQVEETVSSYGGYIENSDFSVRQDGRESRFYSLTARIPADKLDTFVEETGWSGTITNKSENIEDVTLDYVDKTAYKESLKAEYERVMELLAQAKDLDQILLLESKLSDLRYELNSYESQLRIYDNQIDYGTVHINISEVTYENGTSHSIGGRIRSGFRSSLYAVRDFFVNFFVWLISSLPVLILGACGIAILIYILRKLKKKFWKKGSRGDE